MSIDATSQVLSAESGEDAPVLFSGDLIWLKFRYRIGIILGMERDKFNGSAYDKFSILAGGEITHTYRCACHRVIT